MYIYIRTRINTNIIYVLQINELYEEVLHEILHSIGAEKNCVNLRSIMSFAQEAFKIEQATHESIYRAVLDKEVSNFEYYSIPWQWRDRYEKFAEGFQSLWTMT